MTKRIALVAVVGLLAVGAAGGQGVPQIKLKPADATIDHEFTRIGTVRELRDGRVLVTDPSDKRLFVVNFASQSLEQIGKAGSGPGAATAGGW